MTLSTVLSFARAQAQTDNNGLTDTNGIIFANEALQDFHRRLVEAGVDASQLQESYTAGTIGIGTYAYPADMLALKTIELNYTDTSANNYKLAKQVDIANLQGPVPFSWLRVNASKASPQFDDRGDWYEIFPTPTSGDNVTQIIRLFYYLKPTEYSATSDTVQYPEALDTAILGWRIASSYLYSLSNLDDGLAFNQRYEERVKQYISTLARGSQQPIQASRLPITGFEF